MKLVPKLTLALFAAMSAILALNGALRVRRDVSRFQVDRAADRELLGRGLAKAVDAVWRAQGPDEARAALDAASDPGGRIRVTWLGQPGEATRDPHLRCTSVPVSSDAVRGTIELCESADSEHRFVETTVRETLEATLALAAVSAIVALLLGAFVVGKPVAALIEQARRIGRGDRRPLLVEKGNDELAALAQELNVTADELQRAADRVDSETKSRIAALEALRHADRLATVGKLASGVAHELGTPLNVVSARAGLIASGDAQGDDAVSSARVIVDAAGRMTKIIRQLLEFARRKGPATSRCDVTKLAATALDLLAPIASKKDVALVLEPGSPVLAEVDASQILQAILNLVMNAVQALPSGGPVSVVVELVEIAGPAEPSGLPEPHVRVSVHDDGIGIASDVLPHVFEPFFTTKEVGEGTGLGLSVTYGIVEDHGGFLEAASGSSGTTFRLYLPVRAGSMNARSGTSASTR